MSGLVTAVVWENKNVGGLNQRSITRLTKIVHAKCGAWQNTFDYCLIYTTMMLFGWFDNLHALKEDFIYLQNESLWY